MIIIIFVIAIIIIIRGNIWSQPADHKKDAKWLEDLRSEVNVR